VLVVRVRETLVGAFYSTDVPIVARGLVVSLELELPVTRWPNAKSLPVRGEITAESLATAQPHLGALAVGHGEVECVLTFSDDLGSPWELRGSARFRGYAWRHSITHLKVELSGPGSRARGDLRLDWHRGLRHLFRGMQIGRD
jgi:hypothetical protein